MSIFNTFEDFEAFGIREGHLQSALQDAWMDYSKSGDISMREFFKTRKETHPHRYNTFAPAADNVEHAAFFNLSAQGAYVREHGEQATRELLASQGLKLGQVKPNPVAEITESTNPYSNQYHGTADQKEKAISALIRSNATLAASLARSAGKTLTGQKLATNGQPFRDPGAARR